MCLYALKNSESHVFLIPRFPQQFWSLEFKISLKSVEVSPLPSALRRCPHFYQPTRQEHPRGSFSSVRRGALSDPGLVYRTSETHIPCIKGRGDSTRREARKGPSALEFFHSKLGLWRRGVCPLPKRQEWGQFGAGLGAWAI